MTIVLPARPADSLQWEKESEKAATLSEIIWEFDLGIKLPLDDEMEFHARAFALETFRDTLFPLFAEKTKGIVLYRGPIDWTDRFVWDERQEALFAAWKEERPKGKQSHLKRLFFADRLAYALQMLAHKLPDEVPLHLYFQQEWKMSKAERAQLLSKERFEHFVLETFDEQVPRAVCFPEEEFCSEEILEEMDTFFDEVPKPFRIVEERFLTEEWGGIEELFVLSRSLSPRGYRKLVGFCASGGKVIVKGEKLGLLEEEKFRGRGI